MNIKISQYEVLLFYVNFTILTLYPFNCDNSLFSIILYCIKIILILDKCPIRQADS